MKIEQASISAEDPVVLPLCTSSAHEPPLLDLTKHRTVLPPAMLAEELMLAYSIVSVSPKMCNLSYTTWTICRGPGEFRPTIALHCARRTRRGLARVHSCRRLEAHAEVKVAYPG